MSSDVCILISTCDRYRPIAEWTAQCIARKWENHPPVRYAGLGDARDWMTVNLSGVESARSEGFRWIYLILDDHPPVGLCRADILNETLPRLARGLGAVNVSLLGWGQRRGGEGDPLGKSDGFLLRNSPDYRWKFSLHPGLWSADALQELLSVRCSQFPEKQRSPWNFERHRDVADGPVRRGLLEGTYRVRGGKMSADGPVPLVLRQAALFGIDVYRCGIRVFRGNAERERFDRLNLWLYHYYQGPYPILWSGAMRQGGPSRDFENFLRFTGRSDLLREWNGIRPRISATC